MTDIIAIVSDLHTNSTVGLCPPELALDDGGTYHASPGQRWLWDCWINFWDTVGDAARLNAADVTVIFTGDLLEGDAKHRSTQLITRNVATIMRLGAETIQPGVVLSKRCFFLRGTPAHSGKSAQYEEALAADTIGAVPPHAGAFSWWYWVGEIGGVVFDIMHHGPMGRLPWSKTNSMNTLAVRIMLEYAGMRVPDLAFRGHNHAWGDTFDNYPVRVIANGAWTLKSENAYRLGIVEAADIGGVIVMAEGGEYEVRKMKYKPEAEKIWTVKA